jgi:hypothetical protein
MLVLRDYIAGGCRYYNYKATKDNRENGIYTAQSPGYLKGKKEARFE